MSQKTAKRDPRTDPRPNYNGREPYRVVRREGRFIVDTPINPDHPDYGEDLYHSPEEWDLFYWNAHVIRVAVEVDRP